MHDINSECCNTSTFYCSFDKSVGRPAKQQLFLLALMEFPPVHSLIYPQTKISLKHLTHLEVSDISRGQPRDAEKHCCLLQFSTVETTGNKCASGASNFLLGSVIPVRPGSSPLGCRMDSSTPPGWEHTPRSHTQIHPRLTPQWSLSWGEEQCQYLIYEDLAVLCKMVTWCASVWISMCVTGRLAEGRVGLTVHVRGEKPCPIIGWHKQNIAMTSAEVTTKFNN